MPKLLDQVRDLIRLRHYSYRTEQTYLYCIRQLILFHKKGHPAEMGQTEVTAFLSYLATDRHVSAFTQNQALSAVLFLYRDILKISLPWLTEVERAPRSRHVPVLVIPYRTT